MNKSILCLALFGLALAIVHMPGVMLTLGVITGLILLAVRLLWLVLEPLSGPTGTRGERDDLARSRPSGQGA